MFCRELIKKGIHHQAPELPTLDAIHNARA
jgi:hypothetical protein